jgi:phospholipid/cholesterol/gamma-HCH transport system substrate-binding protein
METRSNNVIVGSVVVLLVIGIFAMVVWLARFSNGDEQQFDIFFRQSVNGLNNGSPVAFNGVPVGKVAEIALLPDTPQYVRVRIAIEPYVPVLKGTTAAVEGVGFTGVSQIQLTGAMQGGDRITEPGPFGVPVIPPRAGALGQLLANAPVVLNNVARLTERLADVLDPANQKSIANILKNVDRTTGAFADKAPQIAAALADARTTINAATATLQRIDALATNTNALVNDEGRPLLAELRQTVAASRDSLDRVNALVDAARPGVNTLSSETVPEATQLIRELKDATSRLGAIAAKLDEDPAGALLGGRTLPEYQPPKEPR